MGRRIHIGSALVIALAASVGAATTEEAAVASHAAVDLPGSELIDRGRDVRGVYLPVKRVSRSSPQQLAAWVRAMGATAVIVDLKDDMGRVVFTDDLPLAHGGPHGFNDRLGETVAALQKAGIYVIGRIVCFKDHWFAWKYRGEAIVDVRDGQRWQDRSGVRWVDPHSEKMRAHIVQVARAATALGVDEIQLDYIRFPVEDAARYARYPRRTADVPRYQVIAATVAAVDRAVALPLSIDVFGLTAYHPEDSEPLGQRLEYLAPYIDAISPMVYLANWPARYYENPSFETTAALIEGAVRRIRERLGDAIAVRPLLQAFRWRAKNFGYAFLRNQVEAAVAGGASGFLFWNAAGRYGTVQVLLRNLDETAPVLGSR